MLNFKPPKFEVDFQDIEKIFAFGIRSNFWDTVFLADFLGYHSLLNLESVSIFQDLVSKIKSDIGNIKSPNLINYLESLYFGLGQKSSTGLFVYLLYYTIAKQIFPEVMAFSYKKLPSQQDLTDQIRDILNQLQPKLE